MKPIYSIALCLIICGCSQSTANTALDSIPVEFSSSDKAFSDALKEIDLTILDESTCLLGSALSMYSAGENYILVDKMNGRISRFSGEGNFLNEIGRKGNGPQEYLDMTNVQVSSDTLVVFSYPDKILRYNVNGDFISENRSVQLGQSSFIGKNGSVFTYHGYSTLTPYRLVAYDSDNTETGYLPYDCKVLTLTLGNDMFCSCGDEIYMLDSYSPSVYKIDDEGCTEFISFDFGKYSIKSDFFNFSDPFESADFLLSHNFAVLDRFIGDSRQKMVQISVQHHNGSGFVIYGYAKDDSWKWFKLPKGSDELTCGPFSYFKDGCVYCLFNPEHAVKFFETYFSFLKDPALLQKIKNSDAHVIAKIRLD